MPYLIIFMGFLFSAGALACDQKPEKLPRSLVCVESLCVSGRCQENSILFEGLNSQSPTAFYELENYSREASVRQSCENDKVVLAANDGDHTDSVSVVECAVVD